jgi:hypothetical protein
VTESQKQQPNWTKVNEFLTQALDADPGNISLYLFRAQIFAGEKKLEKMAQTMELGLSRATDLDWATAYYAHSTLLRYYKKVHSSKRIAEHQYWVNEAPAEYVKNRK